MMLVSQGREEVISALALHALQNITAVSIHTLCGRLVALYSTAPLFLYVIGVLSMTMPLSGIKELQNYSADIIVKNLLDDAEIFCYFKTI